MSTLSQKRYVAYQNKTLHKTHENELDQIETNTDELETKLDSVIVNTAIDSYSGSTSLAFTTSETLYTPVIDLGIKSKCYNFAWVGVESSHNFDYTIEVSTDNVTFYPYPSSVFLRSGSNVSTNYSIPFRYHKVKIVHSHSSSQTVNLSYSGRP